MRRGSRRRGSGPPRTPKCEPCSPRGAPPTLPRTMLTFVNRRAFGHARAQGKRRRMRRVYKVVFCRLLSPFVAFWTSQKTTNGDTCRVKTIPTSSFVIFLRDVRGRRGSSRAHKRGPPPECPHLSTNVDIRRQRRTSKAQRSTRLAPKKCRSRIVAPAMRNRRARAVASRSREHISDALVQKATSPTCVGVVDRTKQEYCQYLIPRFTRWAKCTGREARCRAYQLLPRRQPRENAGYHERTTQRAVNDPRRTEPSTYWLLQRSLTLGWALKTLP